MVISAQSREEVVVEAEDRSHDATGDDLDGGAVGISKDGNEGNDGGGMDEGSARVDVEDSSSYLSNILKGRDVPLDTSVPLDDSPHWVDDEKLERGRKFAVSNLLGVVYAEMLSLAFLFSMRGSLEALVFTGKSHSPIAAFERYLSTVKRVISWYEGDHRQAGSEARKNMMAVRAVHARVARDINSSSPDLVSRLVSLEARGVVSLASPRRPLQRDFEEAAGRAAEGCPFAEATSLSRDRSFRGVHLSQLELSVTQFGFMGLLLLFPGRFGAWGASESDLEAFVHLWRALGHSLGILDRYNFCSGSLDETRKRCRAVLDDWLKPLLGEASLEWEHMYRCAVEGSRYYVPVNTYGGSLAYLCWVVGVNAPRLLASLTWWERFMYFVQRLSFSYLCRLPGFVPFINFLLRISLWRANKFASAWIKKHERRRPEYVSTHL